MKRKIFESKIPVDSKLREIYFGKNVDFSYDGLYADERSLFSRNDR